MPRRRAGGAPRALESAGSCSACGAPWTEETALSRPEKKRPYVSGAAPGCPRGGARVGDPWVPAGPEVRRGSGRALGPRPTRGTPRTEGTTARGRGPAPRGWPRGAHTETIDGEAPR
ncbi:hypothetical protein NDU88_002965 [Pleurodeles waltl]|uniref:Uncharacterized protein n=1 Tax=Pleurodeles waltl TaxID=8319 RepID=A0AAV7RH37_PLEWA|nr:hypothetical protein NDU88_002965 [Pleurodeles waltl]